MSSFSFRNTDLNKTPWIFMGLLLLIFFSTPEVRAQVQNSETQQAEEDKPDYSLLPKNPKKATILSAALPGAGQVYNGKSWKVPILYAGFMTDIYFIGYNNKRYQTFIKALNAFDEGDNSQFPSLNRDALVRNVNYWRQNRDLTILLLLGIYALNIIDANVDAHLSGFDISDDLAFKIEPNLETLSASNTMMGISFKLQFK